MNFDTFASAAMWRSSPSVHFGQAGRDLRTFMRELNDQIASFDDFITELALAPEPIFVPEFFEFWDAFVRHVPPLIAQGHAVGWGAYFEGVYPAIAPGQKDAPVWADTAVFEGELIRFHDTVTARGATPPIVRPMPSGPPPPPAPAPPGPPAQPEPGPEPPPTPLDEAGTGIGVLFLLAGAALYVAGRRAS